MKNKAVVLGSNYYIGLSAIRCLGVKGIYTAAVDYSERFRYGAQSKYCREKIISPNHRENPGAFIDFLKEYAAKQDLPPVLIPCHDSYVEIVDTHLDELKEYYLIPQTEAGLCARLLNKAVLHRLAMGKGITVPEMVRVDEENFLEKVEDTIKYPCLVKPTDSASFTAYFRRKMFVARNREELKKAVAGAREAGYEVFVQRIIPGFDDHMYTFDAYLDQESKVTHWLLSKSTGSTQSITGICLRRAKACTRTA